MKKIKFKLNKKLKIISSIILLSIILPISIVYVFYKPTTINKLISNKLYKETVSSYFNDTNFYNCIIDIYNHENNTNKPYTYNLSESELASIKNVSCDNKEITDTTGIEKLVNLTYLSLHKNKLTTIDISKNTNLTILYLSHNNLTTIDVSKNTNLTKLYLYYNRLTELDVSKNTNLTILYLSQNYLTELDVSKNTNLTELYLYQNKLITIDVSKNTNLTKLVLHWNKLITIDVSKNTNLTYLDLGWNNLTTIDVSKNTNLTELILEKNNLTELDLSKNTKLTTLLSLKNNKFIVNTVIYKNTFIKLPEPNIILPEGITLTLKNIPSDDNFIISSDNKVNFPKSGKYDVNSEYQLTSAIRDDKFTSQVSLSVIELVSDKYIIDEDNEIIYYSNIGFNTNNISFKVGDEIFTDEKLTTEYSNNVLTIKYNDNVIKTYTIKEITVSSDNYIIKDNYIYIENSVLDINKLSTSIGTLNINGNVLEVKYNDNVIKTYNICGINFGNLKSNKNLILIENELSYEDFIKEITTNNVTYKIEKYKSEDNNTLEEVTSGNITSGMFLNVYKDNKLLETYNIVKGYYKINNLKVDETNNYILDIKDKTSLESFLTNIETSGTVTIKNKDNEEKSNEDLVATGDTIKIDLGTRSITYTLVVKGDVDGDGDVTASDAYKVLQHSIGRKPLEGVYLLAGQINGSEDLTAHDAYKILRYSIDIIDSL